MSTFTDASTLTHEQLEEGTAFAPRFDALVGLAGSIAHRHRAFAVEDNLRGMRVGADRQVRSLLSRV